MGNNQSGHNDNSRRSQSPEMRSRNTLDNNQSGDGRKGVR